MSSDLMIVAEHVGKKHRIRRPPPAQYAVLRDVLAERAASLVRAGGAVLRGLAARDASEARPGASPRGVGAPGFEDFWALEDVSFQVKRGDIVGIIGRNGAGKSTLLKILSRITEPTAGRVRIRGRVASLLEVGTGFHPELTGRENIFLNGAILGMTRAEIAAKFDEIVEFAGVEPFLDTPVKRYSSGMHVRLAFAVAAHLEPEILIVDEVLAVGDAAFQRKSLGKMGQVANSGRTILFVTHNMAAVESLCTRAILLDNGKVTVDASVGEAVERHLSLSAAAADDLALSQKRRGTGGSRFIGIGVHSPTAGPMLESGKPARFEFEVSRITPRLACSFTLYNNHGQALAHFTSATPGPRDSVSPGAGNRIVCEIDPLLVMPGRYRMNAALTRDGELLDHVESAAVVHVKPGEVEGRATLRAFAPADVCMPHRWTLPAAG